MPSLYLGDKKCDMRGIEGWRWALEPSGGEIPRLVQLGQHACPGWHATLSWRHTHTQIFIVLTVPHCELLKPIANIWNVVPSVTVQTSFPPYASAPLVPFRRPQNCWFSLSFKHVWQGFIASLKDFRCCCGTSSMKGQLYCVLYIVNKSLNDQPISRLVSP